MTIDISERLDGPPPLPRPYGLLQAMDAPAAGVRLVVDVDGSGVERWLNGGEVYPFPVDCPSVWDTCAAGTYADTEKSDGTVPSRPTFRAFTVYLPVTCSTQAVGPQDAYVQRARMALEATESAAVARELLTGEKMLLNPHLADDQGDFPNGNTVTSVLNGVALLEANIAASCRGGLIHISPAVAAAGGAAMLFRDVPDRVLRTFNGTVVIPDAGYQVAGSHPPTHTTPTGTKEWIYATGPIDIRRSEVFVNPATVAEALDRGLGATRDAPNSITYYAERHYLVDWDTVVQAAVLVDRCQLTC